MALPPGVGAYGLVGDYRYGRAFEHLATLPNFVGNASGSYPVGGTYIERVVSVTFKVTAVGSATRIPQVAFLDEQGIPFSGSASAFNITAGLVGTFVFAQDTLPGGSNGAAFVTNPLPAPFLQPGYSVQLSVAAGLVADTISNIRILTQKFSTAPQDFAPGQGETVTPETLEESYVYPLGVV